MATMNTRQARDMRVFTAQHGSHGGTFTLLLAALVILLVLKPVLESVPLASSLMASVVLVVGILSVHRGGWVGVGMALALMLVLGLRWIAHFWGEDNRILATAGHAAVSAYLFLLFLFCVAVVLHRGRVTSDTIVGAVCGYLLIGFAFAFWYEALEAAAPGSFVSTVAPYGDGSARIAGGTPDFLYYSIVVLTTVGFGDIVPAIPAARSSAMLEMLAGQLYLAAFVARVVGILGTDRMLRPSPGAGGNDAR